MEEIAGKKDGFFNKINNICIAKGAVWCENPIKRCNAIWKSGYVCFEIWKKGEQIHEIEKKDSNNTQTNKNQKTTKNRKTIPKKRDGQKDTISNKTCRKGWQNDFPLDLETVFMIYIIRKKDEFLH